MASVSLADNYAAAFTARLQPGRRPALLAVDMVVAYTDPASPLYCPTAAAAVEVAQALVEAARDARAPVIFTVVEYEPGGADGGVFYRETPVLSVFERGSPLGALPAALDAREGETLTKQFPSAFFRTGLAERLRGAGIDTLLIAGFSTSGCVRASAVDAMSHGFIPLVMRDACADRHPDPHEASLFDLQAKYAEVIDSRTALAVLADEGRTMQSGD